VPAWSDVHNRQLGLVIGAFGLAYLAAVLLFGELLGSTADSTETFTQLFDSESRRVADITGGIVLLIGAALLAISVVSVRASLPSPRADALAAVGMLAAAGLLFASTLLAAPAVMRAIGAMFGDPGMDPGAAAGLAQAGAVALFGAILLLGATTVLTAHVCREAKISGRGFVVAAWVTALLGVFAVTVAAAAPLGLWWLAFGWRIRTRATTPI
jgi:MFS family permease